MKKNSNSITNKAESGNFLRSSVKWRGSVSPRILRTLIILCCYSLALELLNYYWQPLPHFDVTPFEYTGVVLGMVLVFRTNAGYERWWEARKLWGGINNQSRNLVIAALNYGPSDSAWRHDITKWTIAFAFATKESLRSGQNFTELTDLLTSQELAALKSAGHMPLYAADKIAALLRKARTDHNLINGMNLDGFGFTVMETQRSLLIDHLGACERILKTPMPLVYAIKIRRFIFMFLLLLPFSLLEKAEFNTYIVFALVAYPLLSLDRIGIELQHPFNIKSLSHLPLDTICENIKLHCLSMLEQKLE
jgi:putative membrane protein